MNSECSSFKAGLWVKVVGYKASPQWNGVTGFLVQKSEDGRTWCVHCPAVEGEGNKSNFEIDVRHLALLELPAASNKGKLEEGAWVQARSSGSRIDGAAGIILEKIVPHGARWAVHFPTFDVSRSPFFNETPMSKVPISASCRPGMLHPVVPTGLRIKRKVHLDSSRVNLDWMSVGRPFGSSCVSLAFTAASTSDMSDVSLTDIYDGRWD